MSIPYSNRTATVTIPLTVLVNRPRLSNNCKEFIDAVSEQVDVWRAFFQGFVWLSNSKIRVTFASPEHMEDIINRGITFRGYPVEITPITTKKWVTVLRLAYGVPDEEVEYALSQYGEVTKVKSDTYMAVNSGVRSVLMKINQPIPSQMRIRGHLCLVFYRGQERTCFKCGETGHQKSDCPVGRRNEDNPWEDTLARDPPPGEDPPGGGGPSHGEDPPGGGDSSHGEGPSGGEDPSHGNESRATDNMDVSNQENKDNENDNGDESNQTSGKPDEMEVSTSIAVNTANNVVQKSNDTSDEKEAQLTFEHTDSDNPQSNPVKTGPTELPLPSESDFDSQSSGAESQSAAPHSFLTEGGFIVPPFKRVARKKRSVPISTETSLACVRKSTSPSPVAGSHPREKLTRPLKSINRSYRLSSNKFASLTDEADKYTQLITESGNLVTDRDSVDSLELEETEVNKEQV